MARFAYTLLLYLITPLIWLRLLWRGRKQPEYLHHLGERYGFYPQAAPEKLIWVHAVSVGETRAAQPLIDGLLARWPEHRIAHRHDADRAGCRLRSLWPSGDPGLPAVRLSGSGESFLPSFPPSFRGVDGNRNLAQSAGGSPTCRRAGHAGQCALVGSFGARLRTFPGLVGPAFASLSGVMAQTAGDAGRLAGLGASVVEVCGNLKFDVRPAADKIDLGRQWRQLVGQRSVWLAASTREGEEELVLDAWRRVAIPDALLVLVPRHPQRFDEVAGLLERRGLRVARRSQSLPDGETEVWLGDSMGEMAAYFSLADLAFVGGSLLPLGGQNLIEAAACGCPVLVGPHTFNFLQATEDAIAAGAALRVANADELGRCVDTLLRDGEHLAACVPQRTIRSGASGRSGADAGSYRTVDGSSSALIWAISSSPSAPVTDFRRSCAISVSSVALARSRRVT
jgi:3-deoxy-D-manno-octulosonic-acid transferase